MRRILQSVKKSMLLAVGVLMLTGAVSNAQSSVMVDPGLNTIQEAMAAHPGDTLILKKGVEYVVDYSIEITQPTVIRGEAYDAFSTDDPPAVIRGSANPGEEGDFFMILAAADVTLIDLGFIGFTWDNKQIKGVLGVTKGYINLEAHGCILQGCQYWMETQKFKGMNFVLHDNIHYNISTTGWDNYGGMAGIRYKGDSITNHTYNCTYFTGGRMMLSGGTGPAGWQWADHCTYVNTFGETFHKNKHEGYKVQNSIFFNTHLRGYVGMRVVDGDTVWGGDYVSYRQLGDTLNGDCAVFPHELDSAENAGDPRRFVVITNNLKYNEQRVLDWDVEHAVSTQPFMSWAMRYRAAEYGWTITPNWTPDEDDGNSGYDPEFEMGTIPDEAFETSWAQRLGRMDDAVPDVEVAWRPDGAEQKDFIWPLPFDFTPMAEAAQTAGSDGYPLGDLNWYSPELVAAWEAGEPNPTAIKKMEALDLNLENYPNPFSSITTIKYNLSSSGHVTMKIYDVTGAEVANLVNQDQVAGQHEIVFDASRLAGGVYFCRIKAGNAFQVQKLSLIK